MNIKLFAKVGLLLLVIGCASVSLHASEATIVVGGTITQSTADGTGVYNPITGTYQAVNNPSLNNILDGNTYSVTINLAGTITSSTSSVTYDLTGAAFTVQGVSASETSFDLSNPLTSLTVSPAGAFDDVFLSVCLTTGSACDQGDELLLDFMIAASELNSASTPASYISGLYPPLNLLEDDGQTDIQGSVTSYSYTSSALGVTPEPASFVLCGSGLLALALARLKRQHKGPSL
jgi:hypothetical protein